MKTMMETVIYLKYFKYFKYDDNHITVVLTRNTMTIRKQLVPLNCGSVNIVWDVLHLYISFGIVILSSSIISRYIWSSIAYESKCL